MPALEPSVFPWLIMKENASSKKSMFGITMYIYAKKIIAGSATRARISREGILFSFFFLERKIVKNSVAITKMQEIYEFLDSVADIMGSSNAAAPSNNILNGFLDSTKKHIAIPMKNTVIHRASELGLLKFIATEYVSL